MMNLAVAYLLLLLAAVLEASSDAIVRVALRSQNTASGSLSIRRPRILANCSASM